MYNKLIDFFNDWDYESQATLKIFKELTDDSLKAKVTAEGRSLGYLAWHITISLGEMMNRTGLNVSSPAEESGAPVSAEEITSEYEQSSASLVKEIKNKWTDKNLSDEVDMYGSKWKNGATLSALITHQVHHRGQMTVLMRQAGLKVPGIYGPALEEWAAFGMTAPR